LKQLGVVVLHVELCRLWVRCPFTVVPGLVSECILGCQFIDLHVTEILPKEEMIRLTDGTIVHIEQDSGDAPPSTSVEAPKNVGPSTKVRVARWVTLPPRLECHVWVQCAAPSVRFLQAILREVSFVVCIANGVEDVVPNQPFRIRMINTSLRECKLPKGTIVGHALAHPKGIVSMVDFTPNDPPTAAKPNVEGLLWKEQVDMNHLLPRQREQMFKVLESHRSMWNGRLGELKEITHRIELKEGARPFRAHPY
jgi:hypothetical protein